MAFEISSAGRLLGSLTPVGGNFVVRRSDGGPIGQFADLAAAVARVLRVAP